MGKSVTNVPKVMDNEVKLIDISLLKPFAKHSFTLYQGERLDDMVESIRKNGVIVPIIARTIEGSDKFEIISGHNRVYASGLAGLEKVPAVVKVGLSDEEAETFALISNLIQRSIKDLKISEQAYAVAMRYKKLFDERKIKAINDELQALEGGSQSSNSESPVGTRDNPNRLKVTAEDYGLGRTTITRLLRVNQLCEELKKFVDSGNIKIRPAVEISYIPKEAQKRLYERMCALGEDSIDMKMARELRQMYKAYNDLTDKHIEQILNKIKEGDKAVERPHKIALAPSVFDKYLKDVPKKDVVSVIEKALEMYFSGARV